MKHNSLRFLLLTASILVSCNNNKEPQERPISVKKNNVSVAIIDKTKSVPEPSCDFNYPKKDLFLGFFSGMTRTEFSNHRDSLIREGFLKKTTVYRRFGGESYDYFYSAKQSNGESIKIKLEAEFLTPILGSINQSKKSHVEVEEQEIGALQLSEPFKEVKVVSLPHEKKIRVDFVLNKDVDNLDPPKFEGFRVLSGPNRAISNSWIGGKRTYSNTYSFFLAPLRKGTITIGQAAAVFEDAIYKSHPITIQIKESIEMIVDKSNICESLVAIKLIGAQDLSDTYSSKYNMPKWPKTGVIEKSKIGRYNNAYDPKNYAIVKVKPKVYDVIGTRTKENTVRMPKSFIDKARKLDLFEEQIYYDYTIDKNQYKHTINVDNDLIVFVVQKFEENQITELSLQDSQINPNRGDASDRMFFILDNPTENGVNIEESQSKQIITTKYFYSRMDVIYTTKKYYEEKYAMPSVNQSNVPLETKKHNERKVNEEI